jgi:acetyl esterase/lipase
MSESELVLYYGLSVGAGLAVALIVYGISEYSRHASRILVYAWIDPPASESKGLSIFVDNQTNSRTVIREAGAILEDGRHIRVTARNEPHSGEPLKPFPVTIAAHEQVTVSIFSLSEENISIGLAACYVIRDKNRLVAGPVHGQLD